MVSGGFSVAAVEVERPQDHLDPGRILESTDAGIVVGIDEDGLDIVTSGGFLTKRNLAVIEALKDRVESGNIEVPDSLD